MKQIHLSTPLQTQPLPYSSAWRCRLRRWIAKVVTAATAAESILLPEKSRFPCTHLPTEPPASEPKQHFLRVATSRLIGSAANSERGNSLDRFLPGIVYSRWMAALPQSIFAGWLPLPPMLLLLLKSAAAGTEVKSYTCRRFIFTPNGVPPPWDWRDEPPCHWSPTEANGVNYAISEVAKPYFGINCFAQNRTRPKGGWRASFGSWWSLIPAAPARARELLCDRIKANYLSQLQS